MKKSVFVIFCLVSLVSLLSAASRDELQKARDYSVEVSSEAGPVPLIPSYQLRKVALHDAGRLRLWVSCGGFPGYGGYNSPYLDPETNALLHSAMFPADKGHVCTYNNSIWVGGIIGVDTLVTVAFDPWLYLMAREFWPTYPDSGGIIRTGNFADDEFLAVFTDTVTDPEYVDGYDYFDDTVHTPLGIKVIQKSYSWKDTLYDDFAILEFKIENIGNNHVLNAWIGINSDPDIFDTSQSYSEYSRAADDASGLLDTLLNGNDPESRIMVPYAFDWDGDPDGDTAWNIDLSTRAAVAICLLDCSLENPAYNFSWWIYGYPPENEFGPRLVGTPEDPFRQFAGGHAGNPVPQKDKYYIMSHREVDYNELEMDIHDSTDGWIPSPVPFFDRTHDTRFIFSFGPLDFLPGDSLSFALAIVGIDNFHREPGDFADYFDPQAPEIFQSRLDFSELMIDLRRADSVYRSGFTLPHPGPPQGLRITEYDDAFVTLAWQPSRRPGPLRYYVNVMDTAFDDVWHHAFQVPISDTTFTYPVIMPSHEHLFAVSLVDNRGRESDVSLAVAVVPGCPHPPCSLTVHLDSLTPVLNWQPHCDTSLMVYLVYRSMWNEPFELYDSVSALEYCDYEIESGIRYNYKISAKNSWELESSLIGPVSVLPMAMDEGVLFYNLNYDAYPNFDPYHRRYVDRLVHSVQPAIPMVYYDIEGGELSFKDMSRHSVIIFDSEKRGGKFPRNSIDSIDLYLSHGGRALFIIPNASTSDLPTVKPKLQYYGEGDFFYDLLYLDSVMINAIALSESKLLGDLSGCLMESPGYPYLEADSFKLAQAPVEIDGYIPLAGFLYPRNDVEIIYRYQSSYPDSIFHNQVNGIAYADETCRFILFNFQLSLMGEPSNIIAFRKALEFLGVDVTCGDVNDDSRLDVGDAVQLVNYLFRAGPPPGDWHRADVNCDQEVDLGDAVVIVNVIFRDWPGLDCCRRF